MRIELEEVSVVYRDSERPGRPALAPTSLSLPVGEWVAVVGPTGSGKTTLLDVAAGLRRPTGGVARLEPGGEGAAHRRQVGLVAQFPEDQFFEETVFDEVAFGLRREVIDPGILEARVATALERASLDPDVFADREPLSLSAGEARRAAVASILVLDRPFLLLDEPTAGLDPGTARRILDMLRSEHEAGRGILFVTHDLDLAADVAERVLVMVEGVVTHDGPPHEVLSRVDELRELGLDPPVGQTLVAALEARGAELAETVRRALAL